jgi:kinase
VAKYDLGDEVRWGHFGYTCAATIKKGTRKRESVAIKVIPKAKVMFSSRNALLWHLFYV